MFKRLTDKEIKRGELLISSLTLQQPGNYKPAPDFPSKWPYMVGILVFLGFLAFAAIYSSALTLQTDMQAHGEIK